MKCMSAARIKGSAVGGVHNVPSHGTAVRDAYDLFMLNRGRVVDFSCSKNNPPIIESLRSSYGLDIRRAGYRRWFLAGEWFGKVYIDYVAERSGGDAA